jgi:hypothetical protein
VTPEKLLSAATSAENVQQRESILSKAAIAQIRWSRSMRDSNSRYEEEPRTEDRKQ